MSLITRLLQEVSEEEKRTGESQCFIGHEFRHKDLRVKLERALDRLGLQAYFADKEVTGEFILTKVCKKILVTRASIVDLTTANPNVYFELGVAIGLNKPVFVVLKQGTSVPPLLENFVKLRFTHYAGLERELVEQVPGWLGQSIEHHLLYNTHCHFVNLLCPDRQRITHQRRYLVIDQIESTDETGQPILTHDPDLRAELPAALDRFHFDPVFLDDVPLQDTFRLCDYCRTLRDSSFALCHLSRHTSPNVYLLLGLVTGLGIPSLLLVYSEQDRRRSLFEIPAMLRGLDAFYYEHSVDIGKRLGDEVEGFLNRQKGKPIVTRTLAFPDLTRRLASEGLIEERLELTDPSSAELLDELTSSNLDLDELLARVLKEIISAVKELESDTFGSGAIWLLDESEQKLVLAASHGFSPVGSEKRIAMEMDQGITGQTVLNKRSLLAHDVRQDPSFPEADVRSFLGVPLIDSAGQVVGVISLESPQEAYFTEEHVRSVEMLARVTALAIVRRARQEDRLTTEREALTRIQSITDASRQAEALIGLLDGLTQVQDTEGVRRVVEVALATEASEFQTRVLRAAARAYVDLGQLQKAFEVVKIGRIKGFCPYCGAFNRPVARFCGSCGKRLSEDAPEQTTIESERQRKPQLAEKELRVTPLSPSAQLSNRYRIVRVIGQGGLARVYQAEDQLLSRVVAIKELSEEKIPQAIERFQQEAKILASLSHPNLPTGLDFFTDSGHHYLVMEYIKGQTLEEITNLTGGPLSENRVLTWAAQLCDTLSYLHSQSPPIIHRNIKPQAIIEQAGSGAIKLISFGIARFYRWGLTHDEVAYIVPGYSPIEQYGRGQTDARSDIYSLGATLYHLLTAQAPPEAPQLSAQQLAEPKEITPRLSQRVNDAIMKALRPNPAERHQSAGDMKEALLGHR